MEPEYYMRRCLQLASMGSGKVAPNPMVGSVIVHEGQIIGEGYHQEFGGPHAEVHAIEAVENKDLLKGSTLYVNLEPCSHYGKTPPCADLIIQYKIPRVFIGRLDSHSKVNGQGVKRLIENGVDVNIGFLEEECKDLNRRFYTFHEKQRPFVLLKWAQSKDGFIDIDRSNSEKGIHWITQPETKSLVHLWRSEESAIIVGRKTIENDDPSLTVREIKGTNPIRIILDPKNKLHSKYKAFDQEAQTMQIIAGPAKEQYQKCIEPYNLNEIMKVLFNEGISSVLVEGGKSTLEHFINSGLWDEARILVGVEDLESGNKAPEAPGELYQEYSFGKDIVKVYRPKK